MPLNQEQAEAVSYLEGPLLVLAGPGTGKTQLLSSKVAYILEHTDANPENILCLTFTESGASNMRERLGTIIGKASLDVNIYTYHAFGSNVLERYKNYAENFNRRLDNVIDGVTTYKLLRQIQEKLPATDILKTANIDDLANTIAQAKSARLSAKNLKKIAEKNLSDSATISELASSILDKLKPRMKFDVAISEVYQPLLEVLADFSSPKPIIGNIECSANLLVRELDEIIKAENAKDKPSISSLTKWKNRRFEHDANGSFRLKDHIANKKLLSLSQIMEKYEAELEEAGLFDFADMIEEAIRILKKDQGFRLSLSEIFQYILLDEFQDTNPSQFELIKLLTVYENPVVMAVGDDDQAIFEFQGANASNLLDFQNHYKAKVITLVNNYRSTSNILNFSHCIAKQISDSFAKHHNVQKTLHSMTEASGKIERHEFLTANDEYYWLANRISELIKQGESPSDIAIIAPKHKHIAPLLPYLKAPGNINISYEKRSNLLEDPRIHELIIIAQFAYELANERQPTHRLLEILSFPFLEITPLVALQAVQNARAEQKSTLGYLLDSDDEKLQNIAKWLAELTTHSFEAPLELWLNELIGLVEMPISNFRSPYLDFYTKTNSAIENFEFYENLNSLKNIVINHTKNLRPKLADFIETLSDYETANAPITNTSPYQDGEQAIQIMSAHKSKGLEFKYVFLPAVDELAWGKAKGNNNLFSLPSNLAQIRHTGITDDERLRLLFVAITRAKKHLILTNSINDFSEKPVARLGYLEEQRDEKSETAYSPLLSESEREIHLHYQDFDIDTRIVTRRQGWSAAYQVLTPDLKLMLKKRLQNYRLTATDLTSFIDIIYAGPDTVFQRRILNAPDEPLTPTLGFGNLIHATFEQITNANINDEDAIKFLQAKALELPLSSQDIKYLQEKGEYSLNIALKDFHNILRDPNAKAEVNLGPEHPSFEGIPLTGKIDHLAIDRKTKTIEIYDFKTGNYHDNNWHSHPTLYKYAIQLGFYKLLLNLSPSYRNYKVTKGHILFVSPDHDDRVYDKVYDYSVNGEEELKKLVKSVHYQITSLNFIENDELNLVADKNRTLKDIKNFITKLLEIQPS